MGSSYKGTLFSLSTLQKGLQKTTKTEEPPVKGHTGTHRVLLPLSEPEALGCREQCSLAAPSPKEGRGKGRSCRVRVLLYSPRHPG